MKARLIEMPAEQRLQEDGGDILFGKEYLASATEAERLGQTPFVLLEAIHPNPLTALISLRVDTDAFERAMTYTCPYTTYTHLWAVPVAILSSRPSLYPPSDAFARSYAHAFDWRWNAGQWGDRIFKLDRVGQMLLGSGYTNFTGAQDGSGSQELNKVPMDNGDFVLVRHWVWYNK